MQPKGSNARDDDARAAHCERLKCNLAHFLMMKVGPKGGLTLMYLEKQCINVHG
jgi:hypothetical protein